MPLEVYTESLRHITDAISALKHNFIPVWAHREKLKRVEAERQLAINVFPLEKGSVVTPLEFGSQEPQLTLPLHHQAGVVFMRYNRLQFDAFTNEKPTTVFSLHVGECFLRAAETAYKRDFQLEIAERRQVDHAFAWKSLLPLTGKMDRLSRAIKIRRERQPREIRTQVVGRIQGLHERPLFMKLGIGEDEPLHIFLTNDIKEKAHANWGKKALVTIRGRQDSEGKIIDATALEVKALVQHEDPVEVYLSKRGSGRDVWGTEEAQEYIRLLRGRQE